MNVFVLGSGAWGTALALLLNQNRHDVTLWSHSADEAALLKRTRKSGRLQGMPLPKTMRITSDCSDAGSADAVVFVTPSFAVREAAAGLRGILKPGAVLVCAAKGMEKETSLRLSEVIEQELPGDYPVVVLSGPSHAEEVGRKIPTACISASRDRRAAEFVQNLFMNERFRVYTSSDVVGVEVGAAFKNVIALCAGCCDGMGLGDNTRAMLMARGLSEMARLGVALGGKRETFSGLAGLGDLIATCTSKHSRNWQAGFFIGQGKTPEEAIREVGAVVEGYYATQNITGIAAHLGVEMPILQGAHQVIYEGGDPREVMSRLMTRAKRYEMDEELTHKE